MSQQIKENKKRPNNEELEELNPKKRTKYNETSEEKHTTYSFTSLLQFFRLEKTKALTEQEKKQKQNLIKSIKVYFNCVYPAKSNPNLYTILQRLENSQYYDDIVRTMDLYGLNEPFQKNYCREKRQEVQKIRKRMLKELFIIYQTFVDPYFKIPDNLQEISVNHPLSFWIPNISFQNQTLPYETSNIPLQDQSLPLEDIGTFLRGIKALK